MLDEKRREKAIRDKLKEIGLPAKGQYRVILWEEVAGGRVWQAGSDCDSIGLAEEAADRTVSAQNNGLHSYRARVYDSAGREIYAAPADWKPR